MILKVRLNILKKEKLQNLFSVCEARRNPYFNMIELKRKSSFNYKKKLKKRKTIHQLYQKHGVHLIEDKVVQKYTI